MNHHQPIPFDYSSHILIFLRSGSNHWFTAFQIHSGKVVEKLKTDIKKEGFRRSKTAESPCFLHIFVVSKTAFT